MDHLRNYGRIANGKISVADAWELYSKHQEICKDFERRTKCDGTQYSPDHPFWAYWFAKNVIQDEWLPGEDVIIKDANVWKKYVQYTENLKALDMLGWTLQENRDFVTDFYGIIKGWKPGRGPVTGSKMAKRTTLTERFGVGDAAAAADRIAEMVQDFKKQRKLKNASQEDDTNED